MVMKKLSKYKPSAKFANDRTKIIAKHVSNKITLDIGSIQHKFSLSNSKSWLFHTIKNNAKCAIGVDIAKKEVLKARSAGYNILWGDAHTIKLNKKFEVITACNIIEHLTNPGIFLDNMYRHLKKDGVLILTTKNNGGFETFYDSLLLGCIPNNLEHTCWYDYVTLKELTRRSNFSIKDVIYVLDTKLPRRYKQSRYSKIKQLFWKQLVQLRSNLAPEIILILKKNEK
jgi:SAM-dependent methyltransferase